MISAYWAAEYAKVFLAYFFLMFVYPSVLFRSYLKGKGRTFWFGFCISVQPMLVSTVVLLLCLLHISNAWLLRALFYGSLAWAVYRMTRLPMTPRYLLFKMGNGTYGPKLAWLHFRQMVSGGVKKCFRWLWGQIRRDWIEILALSALLVYGIVYFSINPLQLHGYGFSDMPVHHYWAYGLKEGKAFVAGIYPEGMHCFAYAVSELFGIRLYSVLLFLQCANIVTFLVSAFLLAREVTGWRGTPLILLALYLTVKIDASCDVSVTSRLQATLPQEFCLHTVFLIPTFLLRYLKRAGRVNFRGKKTRMHWDENILIFCLAIAVSISVHFYATIMAVFSCLAVVVIWPGKVFHPRRVVPLGMAAVLGLLLAAAPMVLAFAEGMPLQGSLRWALNLMKPKETTAQVTQAAEEVLQEASEVTSPDVRNKAEDDIYIPIEIDEEGNVLKWGALSDLVAPQEEEKPKSLLDKLGEKLAPVKNRAVYNANGLYRGGYRTAYEESWAEALVQMSLLVMAVFFAWHLISGVLRFLLGWKWARKDWFDGYAMTCMMGFFFMLMLSANRTDFPVLIDISRVCTNAHVFMLLLLLVPVDLVGRLLAKVTNRYLMQAVSVAAAAAVCAAVFTTGNFHGFLFLLATRFNSAVDVTNAIISEMPKMDFTVVSPTDELYQVIERGYHEEILTFVQKCEEPDYYIPTRYVFFYLEKTPIRYASEHFPEGPEWLGNGRYMRMYGNSRQGGEIYMGETSEEKADGTVVLGRKLSNAYTALSNREIVESKMARYMEGLLQDHANEITVYYEDENFICYCLEQNPARLVNFGSRKA